MTNQHHDDRNRSGDGGILNKVADKMGLGDRQVDDGTGEASRNAFKGDAGGTGMGAGASPGSTTDNAALAAATAESEGGIGTSASSVIGADREELSQSPGSTQPGAGSNPLGSVSGDDDADAGRGTSGRGASTSDRH